MTVVDMVAMVDITIRVNSFDQKCCRTKWGDRKGKYWRDAIEMRILGEG